MATYPTPLQSVSYDTGPLYLKYLKVRKDWAAITLISTYEDKGIDTNESADNVLQEWILEYDGLSDQDAKILDDFWNAHRLSVDFTFIEPRDDPWTGVEGGTFTGCRFIAYEKDHSLVLTGQKRSVRIGKYPS